MNENERQKRWAKTAVNRELNKIRSLPEGNNIFVPNSQFWQSLFKIAGIVNGGYETPSTIFVQVWQACEHLAIEEKQIRYQWRRACQQAKPRRLRV